MNFDIDQTIQILSRTPNVLDALLKDLPPFWTEHREGKNRWNAKEVVAHLVHGELEDWINRTKIILFEEDKKFIPFDPNGFSAIVEGKSLDKLLTEFRHLREKNVSELAELNLQLEDLDKTGIHPQFGEVTLRQHLSTWTIHDLNHLYQISRVLGKKYTKDAGPWKRYIRVLRD